MAKGLPNSRNANIASAAIEGKKVLLQTKSWPRTQLHLKGWIKVKYSLSRTTVADYINDVYYRLLSDPEVKHLVG